MGFHYASDTRGREPFLPSWEGIEGVCPQLPTTLPTLDELIGRDGLAPDGAAQEVLRLSQQPLPHGHVFTLHAELEGMALRPTFRTMLERWRDLGFAFAALGDVHRSLDVQALPRHAIALAAVPGRSGLLATQAAAG